MQFLTIINDKEVFRFPFDKIVYVTSDGNYSVIHMADGSECTLTTQLKLLYKKIKSQLGQSDTIFTRVGKQLVVNIGYVSYVNPTKQELKLKDYKTFTIKKSASQTALKMLKDRFTNGNWDDDEEED
ncbi:MAG: LytTR family transcriptional regulator [Bacteroidales bacterium]|jgi:DNA-binding LytR/AlgR family response regulator|nr:LytTR family transcriptional regulator [Bacteroidales bacterium]MBP5214880.1 LytTR family transcriptional regulator [Bacteroidales bacterium]